MEIQRLLQSIFSKRDEDLSTWICSFSCDGEGGYFLAVFLLQLQLSKENLPKNCADPQKSISSPTEFLWEYYGGRPGVYWAPAWALKWPIILMNVWEFCLSTHRSNGNVAGCFDHTFFFVAFSVFGGSLWGPVGIIYNISKLIYIYLFLVFFLAMAQKHPKAGFGWDMDCF